MKRKKRKHGKVRLRARRSAWSVHAKRRAMPQKQGAKSAPVQWLRITTDRREDDLNIAPGTLGAAPLKIVKHRAPQDTNEKACHSSEVY